MKRALKTFAVLLLALTIALSSAAAVFAEPNGGAETDPAQQEPETAVQEEQPASEQPATEQPATEQPASEQPASDQPPETPTEENTREPSEESTEEEETEPVEANVSEPSRNVDDLPEIEENEFTVPTAVIEEASPQSATVAAGIISWLCVALGVIVIIAVLGSSRTGNYMNGGKQRYESGDMLSGGKYR